MKTGIIKDARFADHDPGPYHVESPQRIEALNRMIEDNIRFPYLLIEPRMAEEEELARVHDLRYIRAIRETAGRDRVHLDPDTSAGALTYDTARLASGGFIKAADLIIEGRIQNAFAFVRPPGHHAETARARGFCIFNNIAVAAEHLVHAHGFRRVLIVDWDLHHGNGTQDAFYSRNDVLFFSTHQWPFYPGSGRAEETGEGEGAGFTLNVPLKAGKCGRDYVSILQNILHPAASLFKPEFILVSAGFDIGAGDLLGGMQVSREEFGWMAAELLDMARSYCHSRIAFVLEGGYNLQVLADGAEEILKHMSGEITEAVPRIALPDTLRKELEPVFRASSTRWNF